MLAITISLHTHHSLTLKSQRLLLEQFKDPTLLSGQKQWKKNWTNYSKTRPGSLSQPAKWNQAIAPLEESGSTK